MKPETPFIDEPTLFRVVSSILCDEYYRQRKRHLPIQLRLNLSPETPIGEEGVGFDSLARIDFASRLNRFFHLHEVGIEDYLLHEETVGGWCALVAKSLSMKCERISFETSGSTGDPKICTHEVIGLDTEVRTWAEHFAPSCKRLVSLVQPHHIYGFLFTVLLPQKMKVQCIDGSSFGPSTVLKTVLPGDLVIGTPFHWAALDRSGVKLPSGVLGLTSTAPMPAELWERTVSNGLNLTEIFGSSETAGLGFRTRPGDGFKLLPTWTRDLKRSDCLIRADGQSFMLLDHLEFETERVFRPKGRKDTAVQVGGINVFPGKVAETLKTHGAVSACAVRPTAPGGDVSRTRLAAFVVPTDPAADHDALAEVLTAFSAQNMRDVERPVRFDFGPELPRNAMGKLTDWTSTSPDSLQ